MTTPPLHAIPLPHLHGAALVVALRGGPRYEGPDEGGLTHFLEHMLFRGAGRHRSSRELFAAFEEVGEEPDAYTSDDALVVSVDVDPEGLAPALELLGQVLREPRYRDLEDERRLILEERLERVDDAGRTTHMSDLARALAFAGHPLSRPIMGEEEDIRRYGRPDLERLRRRLVRSGNVVVVAAGPLGARDLARAGRALGPLPEGAGPVSSAPLVTRPGPRTHLVELSGSAQVDLCFTFVGPGAGHPDHPTLEVLVDVLDGGPTSRLPERLVDSGLAYYARTELTPFPDVALVEVEVSLSRDGVAHAVAEVLTLVEGLGEGIEAWELARATQRRRRRVRRQRDDALDLADAAARRLLHGLDPDRSADDARAEGVTAGDAETLARAVFNPERLSAVMVGSPTGRQRAAARRALSRWVR